MNLIFDTSHQNNTALYCSIVEQSHNNYCRTTSHYYNIISICKINMEIHLYLVYMLHAFLHHVFSKHIKATTILDSYASKQASYARSSCWETRAGPAYVDHTHS